MFAFAAFITLVEIPGESSRRRYDSDEDLSDNTPIYFYVRFTIHLARAFSIPASVLALIGSTWQHSDAVAYITGLQNLGSNAIQGSVGAAAMALAWISLFFLAVVTVGLRTLTSTM